MMQNTHWSKNPDGTRPFVQKCAVLEMTSEGLAIGRCWRYLPDGRTCRLHGDVSLIQKHYEETGDLTRDDGKPIQEEAA
jgi:hypothetical protein